MASLDPGVIGTRIPEHTVEVERGRLSFFARATGQDDPIYTCLLYTSPSPRDS